MAQVISTLFPITIAIDAVLRKYPVQNQLVQTPRNVAQVYHIFHLPVGLSRKNYELPLTLIHHNTFKPFTLKTNIHSLL